MKEIKLKLIYWLMKSLNMRFLAIEMNEKTEELSLLGNMDIVEFEFIMAAIKQIKSKSAETDSKID